VEITHEEANMKDILFEKCDHLRSILDNLDDYTLVFSTEEVVLECNKPLVECLNKSYNDIVGSGLRTLHLFSDEIIDTMLSRAKHRQTYVCEEELCCAGDNSFPATISSQIFQYDENEAVLCTIKNISEIEKLKENLKLSDKKYCDIIENGNDGIAILQNGRIKFANRRAADILGYTKREVINDSFLKYISPEHHKKALLRYDNTLNDPSNERDRIEIELVAKSGHSIPVEVSDCLIEFENEKAYLVIYREISKQKEIEQAIQREKQVLENYLDVVGSIIGILDKDQNILFVNKKGCEVLGYSKKEIIGQNWFDRFLPDKVREQSREGYIKMMAGEIKPPEYMENWIVTKAGEERLVYWHDVVLRDEDGNITGTISSGEDITNQKIMQKQIQDSESKLSTIFNSIDDQIYICDQDRNIIDVNDAVVKHLGFEREELLKMGYDQLIAPEFRITTNDCAKKLVEDKHRVFETTLMRKDGSIFPVEINAKVIAYEGSEAIICVDRDISDRKYAENELKNYAEELKESNELKELFTDIIRHDLLSPASIIKGYSEELMASDCDEDVAILIKKIHENNNRLIDLLESATKLSKLQKMDEIEFENLNIVAIFQMVAECLKPNVEEKHQKIVINTQIKCDSKVNHVIEEVFTNLLSNAIKYSPEGSSIFVDFIDLDDEWKITVSDEGVGINDNDKMYIFDRFRRADKKGIKGTGLGLAIVKRIIDLHGGRFGVKDNLNGQGSLFWVTVKKSSTA
jgi:PAS domain S-box-containing protein